MPPLLISQKLLDQINQKLMKLKRLYKASNLCITYWCNVSGHLDQVFTCQILKFKAIFKAVELKMRLKLIPYVKL